MDVHKVVRDQAAVALQRHRPVDIGGGVPLVDLGLLVEPAHMVAAVVVEKVRRVVRFDLMSVGHAFLHVVLMEEG